MDKTATIPPELKQTAIQAKPVPAKAFNLRGHLDLLDPVTWTAGPQGFICGAVAAGAFSNFGWRVVGLLILGIVLSGPLTIGFSQSINDYFDREIDAINEPTRPIPAGLVTLREARLNFSVVAILAVLVSIVLAIIVGKNGPPIVVMTLAGLIIGALYSVPPLAFKRNGLAGPLSVGFGYNLLTWMVGNLVFADFKWEIFVLALVSASIAVGLLALNDVKSVEGDRTLGIKTLPVLYGMHGALTIAYLFIDVAQVFFAVFLFSTGRGWLGGLQVVALLIQFYAQRGLWQKSTHRQFKIYLLIGNPWIVLIAILAALSFAGYI